MAHRVRCLSGFLLLGVAAAAPVANAKSLDAWLDASVACVETLAGFNEGRPWLQLKFADDRVTVMVESGGRDGVMIALSCVGGGESIAEGGAFLVPAQISGDSDLPDERLPRNAYDRAGLAELVERGRSLAEAPEQPPLSLVVTSLALPGSMVQTTIAFEQPQFRSLTFDATGRVIDDQAPPESEWIAPPVEYGPSLGIEAPISSGAKVMEFLRGSLGSKTVVHRLVVDTGMVTAAYDDAAAGYVLRQWTVDEGMLVSSNPPSPIDGQLAELYKRCSRPATAGELPSAFDRLHKQLGERIEVAMMLTLDCYSNGGKAIGWELLGGDGKVVEGQPLLQEKFRFQP
jgi:hypothetical protein